MVPVEAVAPSVSEPVPHRDTGVVVTIVGRGLAVTITVDEVADVHGEFVTIAR